MACPGSGRLSAHVLWLCTHAGSNRGSSGYSRQHIPIPDWQMKYSLPKLHLWQRAKKGLNARQENGLMMEELGNFILKVELVWERDSRYGAF